MNKKSYRYSGDRRAISVNDVCVLRAGEAAVTYTRIDLSVFPSFLHVQYSRSS